jgi:aminodeoxyfutalosine deaminase
VAVRGGIIVAAGAVDEVLSAVGPHPRRIDLHHRLLIPGLVNAHTHLDLTAVGCRPYGGDFVGWIKMVIDERRRLNDTAVSAAVLSGLRASREAGVLTVGDIAGSMAAARSRVEAADELSLRGTTYLECFGFGNAAGEKAGELRGELSKLRHPEGVQLELQPHAPYSAGREVYEAAHDYFLGRPSTHLAETLEELEFVRSATGPLADFLKEMGKWDESLKPTGRSPVEYLLNEFRWGFWLLAHCNYVTDSDLIATTATAT